MALLFLASQASLSTVMFMHAWVFRSGVCSRRMGGRREEAENCDSEAWPVALCLLCVTWSPVS